MRKILLGFVLGVASSFIGYSFWVGDAPPKIPSKIGCKIVNCYEGQVK